MNRRRFLKGLLGAMASLLGLGAAKAAASSAKVAASSVKEPLRIVRTYGNYETWRCNGAGQIEMVSGGNVRLNRIAEPGERLPVNHRCPAGFQIVESNVSTVAYRPEVIWDFRCVENKVIA